MWKCPVCDSTQKNVEICTFCGFDGSTDYQSFPTLMPVSSFTVPQHLSEENTFLQKASKSESSKQKHSKAMQKSQESVPPTGTGSLDDSDKTEKLETPIDEFVLGSTRKGYAIRKYTGNRSIVVIPEEIRGRKTLEISDDAFDGNESIEVVYIPSAVRVIGNNAFRNCEKLREIHAHAKVRIIGSCAFQGCTSLNMMDFGYGAPGKKLVIFSPKTTQIGNNAFCNKKWYTKEDIFVVKEATVNMFVSKRAFSSGIPVFRFSFLKSLFYYPEFLISLLFIIAFALFVVFFEAIF